MTRSLRTAGMTNLPAVFIFRRTSPSSKPTASWMTPRAATAFSSILFPVAAPWYLRTIATCRRERLMSLLREAGFTRDGVRSLLGGKGLRATPSDVSGTRGERETLANEQLLPGSDRGINRGRV